VVAYIYLDDCSYSGNQIYVNIFNITNKNNTYIFLPYISENALTVLSKLYIEPIQNIQYITCFKNFESLLNENEKQSYKNVVKSFNIYKNSKDNNNICNIYFDHKLADFISIFQNLYAYGRLPDNTDVGSFISGCENFYQKNIVYRILDLQDEFPEICPSAFYKNINYIFKNNIINHLYKIKLIR